MTKKTKTTMRVDAYILGTLALAILSGCAKIEQREAEAVQLSWQVIQDGPTKASAYNTGDTFLSWAWYLPDGKSWSSNKADAERYIGGETSGATIGYVSSKNAWKNVVWGGTNWKEGVSYYWPKAGKLSFFAAIPSSLGSAVSCTATNGIKITDWDVNANQDTDIMVADLVSDQNGNTSTTGGWLSGVPTVFRHKLSQIVGFEFNTLKDYSASIKFYVTGISLKNIIQKGTYVSGAEVGTTATLMGKWTADVKAAKSNYNYFSGTVEVVYSTTEGKKLNPSTIMILPQKFSNPGETPDWDTTPHLEISYKAGSVSKTARVSLYDLFPTHEIGMNKKITIKVTFSNEGNLITWAPDQDDWTESEFTVIM